MTRLIIASCVGALLGACGSGEKASRGPVSNAEPTKHNRDDKHDKDDEDGENAPASAREIYAKSALTPLGRQKLKPFIVSFSQVEGDELASVDADEIAGLAPGTYHLVVHEGDSCGTNAAKAGPPWRDAHDVKLLIVIARDFSGGLRANHTRAMLDGKHAITDRTLVLHADQKGKPGKAIACGRIEPTDEP